MNRKITPAGLSAANGRRRAVLASLTLTIAMALPVLTTSPAQAYPSQCSSGLTTTNGGVGDV